MSVFSGLIEQAAAVRAAASQSLTESSTTSPRKAAENRLLYRSAMRTYLGELVLFLENLDVPAEAAEPIETLAEHLAAIDDFAAAPALFQGGGMPFGLTKPIARLIAEGHAVGCAAYLHEEIGLRKIAACNAVASLFALLGHTGRITERLHGPGCEKLSGKTIYHWFDELDSNALDEGLGPTIRRAAKCAAFEALITMEQRNPTQSLPPQERRMKFAERVAHVAAGTRVGAPTGLKVIRSSF